MHPPSMHALIEPKQEPQEYREPIVGLFSHPLHSMSTFSGQNQNQGLSHRVSEPELVGVKTTISPLNSLAGMM
jgi:hypothetical protein